MNINYQKTLVFNVDHEKIQKNYHGFEHVKTLISRYQSNKLIFVNTGHGFFNGPDIFLNTSKEYIGDTVINTANKDGCIFYMWEPICCYSNSNNHFRLSFYHEFNHTVSDIKSYEIDSVIDFCKQAGIINYEIKLCDNDYSKIFANSYPHVKISYTDIYLKSMPVGLPKPAAINLDKRFICPNARYTPHRHLVMCHLANKNGIYSWNFECEKSLIDIIPWLDKTNSYYNDIVDGNNILNNNHFNIDYHLPKISVNRITDFKSIHEYMYNGEAKNLYENGFCAVVSETRFAQPFSNFSEKVLRPIYFNIPFILVAPPFTLSLLKSYGFKTFDTWWSEDYDLEENHSVRLFKIFEIIDHINSLTQHQIEKLYQEMLPTLMFNSQHLQNIDRSI